jgi:hypothetical protein
MWILIHNVNEISYGFHVGYIFFIFNSVTFDWKFPFIFNIIFLTMLLHTLWLEIIGTSITLLHRFAGSK